MSNPAAITLNNVSLRYGTRAVRALHDVTSTVPADIIVGLVGRNGAGKSSLLRLLTGREPDYRGEAHVYGVSVRDIGRHLGLVHLGGDGWPHTFSYRVDDIANRLAAARPLFDRDRAYDLLVAFQIDPKQVFTKLSRGQQSAAQAALALASRSPLTLLDEPQLAMDAPSRTLLARAIIDEQAEHPRTWVISTHLIDETAPLFERVIVLDSGTITADEDVDVLLTRYRLVQADATQLESLPHLGKIDRLGGRGSAIVPVNAIPSELFGHSQPLSLQTLVGVLPLDEQSS